MRTLVIGVDPGATTGLAVLTYSDGLLEATLALQAQGYEEVTPLVEALITQAYRHGSHRRMPVLAVEAFVVGPRAAHVSSAHASACTRVIVSELSLLKDRATVYLRAAGLVKPWATDRRLEHAGLLPLTKGMRHARDAARHALYAAVHDGIVTDPMSARRTGMAG